MNEKIKNQKYKIVFFGTPQFAALVLQKLTEEKLSPQLIITAPDKPVGRKQILTPSPIKILALENKIPVETPPKIRENPQIFDKIKKLDPDLVVVAAYGKILPKELLNIPKFGSINVHASILPKYRGASPIQTAILEGETETGVTIMLMDEKMDEGDIIAFQKTSIKPDDTYQSLSEKLAQIGANLLVETIPLFISSCEASTHIKKSLRFFLPPLPQDNSKATYTKIIKKEDGQIDIDNPPKAKKLNQMIRAFHPWPGIWARYQISGNRYQMIKFLPNDPFLIQPEGKRPMTIKEFLNGHKEAKTFLDKILN